MNNWMNFAKKAHEKAVVEGFPKLLNFYDTTTESINAMTDEEFERWAATIGDTE